MASYNPQLYSLYRKLVRLDAVVQFNSSGVPTLMQWVQGINGQPGSYQPAVVPIALNIPASPGMVGANVNAITGTVTLSGAGWTVNQFAGCTITDSTGAVFTIESNTATVMTVVGGANPTPTSGAATVRSAPLFAGQKYGTAGIVSVTQNSTIFGTGAVAADLIPAPDFTFVFAEGFRRVCEVTVTQLGEFSANTPTLPVTPDLAIVDNNYPQSMLVASPTSSSYTYGTTAATSTGLGFFQDSFTLQVPYSTGPVRQVPLAPSMTALTFMQAVNLASVDWISITIGGITAYPILTTSISVSNLAAAINTAISKMGISTLISATASTYVTIASPVGAPPQSFTLAGNPATLAALGFGAGSFTSTTSTATEQTGWVANPFIGTFLGAWKSIAGGVATTSSATAALSWTQSSATWTVNQFAGGVLIDHAGVPFYIVSNTATVLTLGGTSATPTSGTGNICPMNGGTYMPGFMLAPVYATVTSGAVVITKEASVNFTLGGAAATLAALGFVAGEATSSQTSANSVNVPSFNWLFNVQLGNCVEVIQSIDGATYSGTQADDAVAYLPVSQFAVYSFYLDQVGTP